MYKIGIIGAGTMGEGIAQIAATSGHDVLLYDQDRDAQTRALEHLQKILNRLVEKGRQSDEDSKAILSRIYCIEDFKSLADMDIIIEAIVENLNVKKEIFRQLDDICKEDAIFATNTSSLSVTKIASTCQHPERVLGLHFFNPAPLMKLVEIVPALQTDLANVDLCFDLMKNWSKVPVRATDTPGFIVNRIARPFYSEALRMIDEGLADFRRIDFAMTKVGGFRMGPFELMDFIGHDVNFAVTNSMYKSYFNEPRYKPSFTQQQLVHAGKLGRKSGQGFYKWPREENEKSKPKSDRSVEPEDIMNRILCMLINEAADALHYKVATREDIDLAMTKGVNYPNGLLKWADEIGLHHVAKTIDALYDFYHEDRYRLSPAIRSRIEQTLTFY